MKLQRKITSLIRSGTKRPKVTVTFSDESVFEFSEDVFISTRFEVGDDIHDDEFESLFDVINTTISNVIKGNHDPTIITDSEESDVFPIRFSDDNTKAKEVSSFNEGLDLIFTEQILQKGKSLYNKDAEKRISEFS